jgi:adenine-specific DNA-methyltransferase
MIYIDPPYNTGNDFVYDDNFTANKDEYDLASEQKDEEGGRLVANTESNGRFHSDWLDMMYPRLKLARNLLRDDGVVFISIDDGEQANLKRMCDEVFGEDNFLANIIWEKRFTRSNNSKTFATLSEHIVCFRKSDVLSEVKEPRNKKADSTYTNPDNDPRGVWTSVSYVNPATKEKRPNLSYKLINPITDEVVIHPTHAWKYEKNTYLRHLEENRLYWGKDGKNTYPRLKRFLSEMDGGMVPVNLWTRHDTGTTDESSKLLIKLMGYKVFDFPKPFTLIQKALRIATDKNNIVLDFFAGSGTTAHAVIQQNAEDGGNRKFIMVQLPEVTDEKSEAYKAGYSTIAEISKERIRRAGKKIKEDLTQDNKDKPRNTQNTRKVEKEDASVCSVSSVVKELDTGFRVLKVDSSNMKDVYYAPDAITQADLVDQTDNIKDDRTAEDLLFQVLLDWGVDLTLPINREILTTEYTENTEKKTKEFEVFFVDGSYDTPALCACFDKDINEDLVKQIAKREPLRAVFRDAGYGSDSTKINIKQIFKLVSPHTEVKAI